GIEDMKDAIRKAAGLLGPAGRILAESTMPGTRATIRARNEIKNAAMAAGILVEPYRGNSPTIPTHPARRVLEGLAVDLMEGDQNAARRINDLTSWLWTRSFDRAIERGASE